MELHHHLVMNRIFNKDTAINVGWIHFKTRQNTCQLFIVSLFSQSRDLIGFLSPLTVQLFFSMNLAEICDNAKKGREYALLGNYDSSIVYYQGVIQQIHKHCQTLRDPALKVKWQQVSFPNPSPYMFLHQLLSHS